VPDASTAGDPWAKTGWLLTRYWSDVDFEPTVPVGEGALSFETAFAPIRGSNNSLARGTEGSNLLSSSGESANLRSRFRDDAVRATASKMRRCWLPGSALDESQKVGVELLLMGDRQSVGCAGDGGDDHPRSVAVGHFHHR
jgi:hypothetical protein